jgi:hypothetical protein
MSRPQMMERASTNGAHDDWQCVRTYAEYADAQVAVDRLSRAEFPVENVEIVGRDLRFVERVTGRLTTGRVALAGAASGAWVGLFVGLLVGLFTDGNTWAGLLVGGIAIGAFWGLVLALVARWAMDGQHDFASAPGIVASRYDVMVDNALAARARTVLGEAEQGAMAKQGA